MPRRRRRVPAGIGTATARALSAVDVRPEERRLVLLLAAHSFLVGIPRVLTSTAAMALFLARFAPADLPYVYMAAAVAVPATGFLRLRLAGRLTLRRLLVADLLAVAVVLVGLRGALAGGHAALVAMLLPVWYEVEWVLLNLEFWGLAGHLLNVRQAKRLFGLVGAGELVAASLAGLSVPWLVARAGTANLLLVSAAAVLGSLALLRILASTATVQAPPRDERPGTRFDTLLRSRYLLLLFALVALSYLGYYVLDNAFYSVAHVEFPDEASLAGFLGVFWAVVSMVTLASRALLSGRVLTRYGLGGGLLALPGAVAAGALLIGASALFAGPLLGAFTVMAFTKLFDQSLRDSLDRTTMLVLYQPLPGTRRVRAQTAVEGIVGPVAGGLSGLTLLFLVQGLGFQPVHLALLLLAVVAAWMAVAVRVRREYTETLSHALATRRLGAGALGLGDASSLAVLHRGIRSSRPAEALYALEALADLGHPSYERLLPELVAHPAPEVRREALERVERVGLASALEAVRAAAAGEGDPVVRGVAMRVLAALGGPGDLREVAARLDDPSEDVRAGALVGVLLHGGAAGVVEATTRLEKGAAAPEETARRFVARVLGEAAATGQHRLLERLLRDPEAGVRRAALAAASRVRDPRLWPLVLAALAPPATRSAARAALIAGGEGTLEAVTEAFGDAVARGDRAAGQRMVRLVARIPGERAAGLLWSWGATEDPDLRHAVLSALAARGAAPAAADPASVDRRFMGEVETALRVVRLIEDLGEDEGTALLRAALEHDLARGRERLLWLLSLLHPSEALGRARAGLASPRAARRAQAVELIESLVDQALAEVVIPLVEDLPPEERRRRLGPRLPASGGSPAVRLDALIRGGDGVGTWIRACAIHAAGVERQPVLAAAVRAAEEDPGPLIRETARAARRRIEGDARDEEGGRMRSTIEKVIILKGVSIFAETPDEVLADVATLLEEVDAEAGEVVFRKGDPGSALYVVVEGRVRVSSQEHVLGDLGPRDIFGEMAALDPEPRSATVTALEATRLFRLEQEALYDVMADRIEIVRGVIRVLCGRLRRVTDRETTGWGRAAS